MASKPIEVIRSTTDGEHYGKAGSVRNRWHPGSVKFEEVPNYEFEAEMRVNGHDGGGRSATVFIMSTMDGRLFDMYCSQFQPFISDATLVDGWSENSVWTFVRCGGMISLKYVRKAKQKDTNEITFGFEEG